MRSVTVEEAQDCLEELLREVEGGAEIEIRRGGRPSAFLSPPPLPQDAAPLGASPAP